MCIVFALAVWLSGCATTLSPSAALTEGPFVLDAQGRIRIALSVNGYDAQPFIVDTAASISAVYESSREALGLVSTGRSTLVHGLSSSGPRELLSVASLTFAGRALEIAQVVVLPDPPSHANLTTPPVGIVGQDVLARFRWLVARDESRVSLFSLKNARASVVGWQELPLTRGHATTAATAIFFLPVDIEGHRSLAVFDLGSGINVVNWPTARRAGLSERDFPHQRANAIEGIVTSTDALPRFVAGDVRTFDTRWREEVFVIANLSIFDALGMTDEPAALLGAGLFTQRDFLLDLHHERVLVRSRDNDRR